jgi:phosphate transport system permease protein
MNSSSLLFIILLLSLFSYWFGLKQAVHVAGGISKVKNLVSLPTQFGLLTALGCGLPALIILVMCNIFESGIIESMLIASLSDELKVLGIDEIDLLLNEVRVLAESNNIQSLQQLMIADKTNEQYQQAAYLQYLTQTAAWIKSALVIVVGFAMSGLLLRQYTIQFKARAKLEKIINALLVASSGIAIFTTLGIVLSVLFESIQFFNSVPIWDFLFGTEWSPQTAMRSDQVGSSGAFGAIPLFAGTLLITFIAMCLAVPVGLMIAIYLSQYASTRLRSIAKPMLEILAGVPTVVYGFFAALTVAPFIRDLGESVGLSVASESALAAGLVMGVMIIPFVSSLSDDAITAVPKAMNEGSLGMGATQSETIKQVLLPAALPGIVGAILLAVSRAIGETMIVVMAAGMAANLTANPLESVTTVTVQIVTLLTGDQEFDSPKTLAAFALGLMLFVTTLALNIIALKVVRKYREQYD